MTGAGSADLVFGLEGAGYASAPQDTDSDSSPDFWEFGRNPSIEEISLDRQLQRLRKPLSVEAAESIAQNAEGSFNVSAVVSADTFKEVEKLVFNDGPGNGFAPGRPSSARVYTNLDYLDGTVARELVGVVPLSFEISYTQGEMVEYTLSCFYATENTDTSVSVTPSDVTRVANDTSVPFHGFDLSIGSSGSVDKLQDATLSFDGIAGPHYGTDVIATDAEVQGVEPTLDVTAIISGRDKYELGLGSTGATTVKDSVDAVSGTITLTQGGTTLSTYNLPQLTMQGTPNWEDVFNSDESTMESYTMNVDGGVSVS